MVNACFSLIFFFFIYTYENGQLEKNWGQMHSCVIGPTHNHVIKNLCNNEACYNVVGVYLTFSSLLISCYT